MLSDRDKIYQLILAGIRCRAGLGCTGVRNALYPSTNTEAWAEARRMMGLIIIKEDETTDVVLCEYPVPEE